MYQFLRLRRMYAVGQICVEFQGSPESASESNAEFGDDFNPLFLFVQSPFSPSSLPTMATIAFSRSPNAYTTSMGNPSATPPIAPSSSLATSTLAPIQQHVAKDRAKSDGEADKSDVVKKARVPFTELPSSPTAQAKLVHASHLRRLRLLYSLKSAAYAVQVDREATERRIRRENNAAARRNRRGGRGRAERDMSEFANDSEMGDETSQTAIDEEDDELRRKCGLPALGTSSEPALDLPSDSHTYDLVYSLSPMGSADVYYHGPHPPPPAPVVRCVLRSAQALPDPGDSGDPLDTGVGAAGAERLRQLAQEIWDSNECQPQIGETSGNDDVISRLVPTAGRSADDTDAEDADWERELIDSFTGACAERVGRTLASLPIGQAAAATAARLGSAGGAHAGAGGAQPSSSTATTPGVGGVPSAAGQSQQQQQSSQQGQPAPAPGTQPGAGTGGGGMGGMYGSYAPMGMGMGMGMGYGNMGLTYGGMGMGMSNMDAYGNQAAQQGQNASSSGGPGAAGGHGTGAGAFWKGMY